MTLQLTDSDLGSTTELRFLLTKLMSECNELAHAVSKALEFGLDTPNPITGIKPLDSIVNERIDVTAVFHLLEQIGLNIHVYSDSAAVYNKALVIQQMMDVSRSRKLVSGQVTLTRDRRDFVQEVFNRFICEGTFSLGSVRDYHSTTIKVADEESFSTILDFCTINPAIMQSLVAVVKRYRVTYSGLLTFVVELERDPDDSDYQLQLHLKHDSDDAVWISTLTDFTLDLQTVPGLSIHIDNGDFMPIDLGHPTLPRGYIALGNAMLSKLNLLYPDVVCAAYWQLTDDAWIYALGVHSSKIQSLSDELTRTLFFSSFGTFETRIENIEHPVLVDLQDALRFRSVSYFPTYVNHNERVRFIYKIRKGVFRNGSSPANPLRT